MAHVEKQSQGVLAPKYGARDVCDLSTQQKPLDRTEKREKRPKEVSLLGATNDSNTYAHAGVPAGEFDSEGRAASPSNADAVASIFPTAAGRYLYIHGKARLRGLPITDFQDSRPLMIIPSETPL